ncbi:PTS system galactitol-specific EIIC component [Sebaldella termitidis]|mgnify:FL=1|jgi:PTS system galactitol-specific IIC component|uniref:PTS system Galactitol-specific IIC component n=1 Tax=Sebaldella termitidis (strain ATCC 33386 / NCTC 11300) TaxID=526218 RepID=D1ARR8_SEBTE|nr:PTS transporter subunit IIC [Sebaldella termitidis]ACZ10554.1 PTS system Galactitol-specific IIC component [Sebaldella termitidis ATCC 33386]MBP7979980.1 PTS galactitol transporter subunit IIC [Sebaldella sp.]SUI25896.1 PTS system galactitol-specific EIIC component [Sebaldella termitidis]
MEILQWILGLGASVMLPIIMFVFAMIMGAGFTKSFRSGITIGIGFTGINLVINLLTSSLGPASIAMTERLGLNLTIIDIGWPAMSAISWAWVAAGLLIPVVLVINFIMLSLKLTKTMNVDLWNFWQFSFIGAAVTATSGSVMWGMVAASVAAVIALLLADYTQKYIENYFGMPGISFPHLTALGFMPLVIPLNWIFDRIPGINKLYASPDTIRKKFGIFGEPMIMGIIIGALLGILAGFGVSEVLKLAIAMASVMFIMPKMVAILMEGLIPVSEAAREFMAKKFAGREIFIGLDAAVSLGEPSVIAVGLLMVPITIILAFIVPGNQLLPFADLAVIPFIVCLITAMSKGNVIRSLMISTIVMAIVLVFATNLAPAETIMAKTAGVTLPDGATLIGNLDRANLITWLLVKFFSLFK